MKDKTPRSHPHEYYVDLVQRAPKVPLNKQTPDEQEYGHQQFGNSFYLLFLTRLKVERSPDPQEYRKTDIPKAFLVRAESTYQKQWSQFLSRNSDLIKKIDVAIDGVSAYLEARRHFRDLLFKERDKADTFEALGVESMGIYAWRQLNPLLEKAAGEMKKMGINPKEFFG